MPHRSLHLALSVLALSLLVSSAALAERPTALGKACSLRLDVPAPGVTHYGEFLVAWREVLGEGHPDGMPKDGADAENRICGSEGCPGLQWTTFEAGKGEPGDAVHGIFFGESGGFWLFRDLGWLAPSPCDGGKVAGLVYQGGTRVLITVNEADGDTSLGRESACRSKRRATTLKLYDWKTGRYDFVAEAIRDGDQVEVDEKGARLTVCGKSSTLNWSP